MLRLELHPWPVADRVAGGLVVAAALTILAVASQSPEPQPGLGVVALGLLGGWLWYRRRTARGIVAVGLAGDGRFWTEYADGRRVDSDVLPGTRRLGRTIALRWRAGGDVRHAWLTPWDVPAETLRELSVRLSATRFATGA